MSKFRVKLPEVLGHTTYRTTLGDKSFYYHGEVTLGRRYLWGKILIKTRYTIHRGKTGCFLLKASQPQCHSGMFTNEYELNSAREAALKDYMGRCLMEESKTERIY